MTAVGPSTATSSPHRSRRVSLGKPTDIRVRGAELYFLPIETRLPLKFGSETLTQVTLARVRLRVEGINGKTGEGWGETPLSVQWVWPSDTAYVERLDSLKEFCIELTDLWGSIRTTGHPLEIGHEFQQSVLRGWLQGFNQRKRRGKSPVPWLAALVCCSAFDLALHDAYGELHQLATYETYTPQFLSRNLSAYLQPAPGSKVSFAGKYPADFLSLKPQQKLMAWHLVGGLDPLVPSNVTASMPDDGHPVLLKDWIQQDGLKCLKIKLRGNDAEWDGERLVKVGTIGEENGVTWLSADFNCTVSNPDYVNSILDRLRDEHPRLYGMLLYVEQPFAYELDRDRLDVHSLSARKPLFLDESAHDWMFIRLGRELGWSGVALKTCKTQTGAILSACWAKAHGMPLMVQDLTNPMLAQIPHVLLAAHVGTIMGVETNSMQFYPAASAPEAKVHPGLYSRRDGSVDLSSIGHTGLGYRTKEIQRELPKPAATANS
jgi:L-alanine-DL-glutamate epimerase-like enolase superfamily enzyme